MGQNAENIEAKLAMYVDGTLDEAGKAEIERHLAANPHHRKLIEDLMLTRRWLVELPRASMPAEINETLQGQLERSVLLDEREVVTTPVHRWPQVFAVAASVLLAIGLAGVVYFVVAGSKPEKTYSIAPTATESGEDSMAATSGTKEADADLAGRKLESAKRAAPEASAKAELRENARDESAGARAPAAAIENESLARARRMDRALEKRGASVEGAAPFVVLVSADDPSAAHEQILNYLVTNSIPWEAVDDDGTVVDRSEAPKELADTNRGGGEGSAAPATQTTQPASQPALVVASADAKADKDAGAADEAMRANSANGWVAEQQQKKKEIGSNVIFARQMTLRQASELSASLEQPVRRQRAMMVQQKQRAGGGQLLLQFKPTQVEELKRDTAATTQPTTGPATQEAPATRETGDRLGFAGEAAKDLPDTAADQERVDVLIVVQATPADPAAAPPGEPAAPPASQPTTQPLAEPAPTTAPTTQP